MRALKMGWARAAHESLELGLRGGRGTLKGRILAISCIDSVYCSCSLVCSGLLPPFFIYFDGVQ